MLLYVVDDHVDVIHCHKNLVSSDDFENFRRPYKQRAESFTREQIFCFYITIQRDIGECRSPKRVTFTRHCHLNGQLADNSQSFCYLVAAIQVGVWRWAGRGEDPPSLSGRGRDWVAPGRVGGGRARGAHGRPARVSPAARRDGRESRPRASEGNRVTCLRVKQTKHKKYQMLLTLYFSDLQS